MNPSMYKTRYTSLQVTLENGNTKTVRIGKYLLKSLNYNPAGNTQFMTKLRQHGMDMVLRVNTGTGTTIVDRALNEPEKKMRAKSHMKVSMSEERAGGTTVISTLDDQIVTDNTGAKIIGEVYRERNWAEMTHYAFLGKGSPEHCQVVLQLAHHWGLTDEDGLQEYADSWLGLDCNGFVGNYLWHDQRGHSWTELGVYNWNLGPDALISGFFEGRTKLTSWDQMDAATMYLMAKCDSHGNVVKGGGGLASAGHIVITEPNRRMTQSGPGGRNSLAVGVVESTYGYVPPGLSESWYTCKSVRGKVFTIDRGANMKSDSRELDMVIAAV